jgi:H2-forming N5,N10-methylenetetrahydromethanopterin dehydrogenase-like enzyme
MKNVNFDEQEKLIEGSRELIGESKKIIADTVAELIKDGGIGDILTIDPKGAMLLAKCMNLLAKFDELTETSFKASKESLKNQELMDQKLNKILEFIEEEKSVRKER